MHLEGKADLVDKLKNQDYSDFDDRMKAAIQYAIKLTKYPMLSFAEDLAALSAAGWSPGAVLEINLTVSYFNMMNRIASGMSVQLEEGEYDYSKFMYGENGRMENFTKEANK